MIRLTPRELAVASRYCRHMRLDAIARELHIAKSTVGRHLDRARTVLGLSSVKALHRYRGPA